MILNLKNYLLIWMNTFNTNTYSQDVWKNIENCGNWKQNHYNFIKEKVLPHGLIRIALQELCDKPWLLFEFVLTHGYNISVSLKLSFCLYYSYILKGLLPFWPNNYFAFLLKFSMIRLSIFSSKIHPNL